jgi:hypothetical protein
MLDRLDRSHPHDYRPDHLSILLVPMNHHDRHDYRYHPPKDHLVL